MSFELWVYANQMYLLHRSIHNIAGSTLVIYDTKIIKKSDLFTFLLYLLTKNFQLDVVNVTQKFDYKYFQSVK